MRDTIPHRQGSKCVACNQGYSARIHVTQGWPEGHAFVEPHPERNQTMSARIATPNPTHVRNSDGTYLARPDLSQCEYKTDKGRRCKLSQGHDGDHAMVLRSNIPAPKSLAELRKENAQAFKGFTLTMEAVPTTEDVSREYTREAEPRDEDQKRVDADAEKNYKAWQKKGSPDKTFDELAKMGLLSRYIFPPAAFDTIILMLRRATQTGGPVAGKRLSYRRKSHTSGNAMVYFVITDKPTKDDNGNGNGNGTQH